MVATILMLGLGLYIFKGQSIAVQGTAHAAAAAGAFPPTDDFAVLASTYTNSGATSITGDLGFTTGPGVAPTVSGTTYTADATYDQAGTEQANTLTALDAQSCDFTFASATDLSLEAQPLLPGVYCITGAVSVGTGGITLTGSGTYIFRMTGALTTVADSIVTLSPSVSSCDVFWTPGAATSLGANSTFKGTVIDNAGITIGSTVNWVGRALAFGGTITSDADTITAPTCAAPDPTTLTVIKHVVNDNAGVATSSAWTLTVASSDGGTGTGNAAGAEYPGTVYTIQAGKAYAVTESGGPSGYDASESSDCTIATAVLGTAYTCTITNDDVVPAPVSSGGGGGGGGIVLPLPLIKITKVPTPLSLPDGAGSVAYIYTVTNIGIVPMANISVKDDKCSSVVFVSGDSNSDTNLDLTEAWVYRCIQIVTETVTNTAVAHGFANGRDAYDTAIATVVVGIPVSPPLINIVKVPSRLVPLSYGGGSVVYTYVVTNPGVVAMRDVSVTDDKCAPVIRGTGDSNNDNLLDTSETWTYTCEAYISISTWNTATAQGWANDLIALDYAFATVVVSAPLFPNTGFAPRVISQ